MYIHSLKNCNTFFSSPNYVATKKWKYNFACNYGVIKLRFIVFFMCNYAMIKLRGYFFFQEIFKEKRTSFLK